MIDLRKPLEGTPGLLLMAALVLFGATIGVSFAIVLKWIDMSDGLATFLGGVVGSGLGAALAVMGAVYVQRLEAKEKMTAPLNSLFLMLQQISADINVLKVKVETLKAEDGPAEWSRVGPPIGERAQALMTAITQLRYFPELPLRTNELITNLKFDADYFLRRMMGCVRGESENDEVPDAREVRRATAIANLNQLLTGVHRFVAEVYKKLPQPAELST
jgi:hypothetical protein